ncbi:hypothetical protein B0H19DRAFT_1264982 [Mycena capillaripes]|nr:hypothetical protein B0H19DRAFT_1264982 [Mycena capillaripes]
MAMAPSPDLHPTVGIWLISVLLEALLHGMGLLQCFLYFVWYHKDPWSFKVAVLLMVALESVQMGASFGNVYHWFITGFGNFDALRFIWWSDMLQLTALYLSMFVAQAHFARCIYHLHKQNVILPAVISLLALVALLGLAKSFNAYDSDNMLIWALPNILDQSNSQVTTNLQAASALTADALITFGLCWRLNQTRGGIQSTNKILNFLIMTAVNRGLFTMVFAALNIILFFSRPETFDFMLPLFIGEKFYMNSMLAMLNTREYAVHAAQTSGVTRLSLPVYEANPNSTKTAVSVSTSQVTRYDESSFVEMGKMEA